MTHRKNDTHTLKQCVDHLKKVVTELKNQPPVSDKGSEPAQSTKRADDNEQQVDDGFLKMEPESSDEAEDY